MADTTLILKTLVEGTDDARGNLKKISGAVDDLGTNIKKNSEQLKDIGIAAGAVFAAISALAIKTSSDY